MPNNQREAIAEYIVRFGSITPMQAFTDLGITKLATRVGEMKALGAPIKTETVKGRNRMGKPIRYSKYSFITESRA